MANFLPKILRQNDDTRRASDYKALINYEAKLGGTLFGEVPKGRRREFFVLDDRTVVWHEEWNDKNGNRQVVTTRYDVRPNGVFKAQGSQYSPLSGEEAMNLYRAIDLYEKRVNTAYDQALQPA